MGSLMPAGGPGAITRREGDPGDGALFSLGNGALCAFLDGPDIVQCFGPPLSAPSLFRLRWIAGPGAESTTRLLDDGVLRTSAGDAGAWEDFLHADEPLLARAWQLGTEQRFALEPESGVEARLRPWGPGGAKALVLRAHPGRPIFHTYPFPLEQWGIVVAAGDGAIEAGDGAIRIAARGRGALLAAFGNDPGECRMALEAARARGIEAIRASFADAQSGLLAQAEAGAAEACGGDAAAASQLVPAAKAVAQLIAAQQSRDGSVLAGHFYHLGYVRDQYGVARALLEMGLHDRAAAILLRMADAWGACGRLSNAHGCELLAAEHRHENDDVEITGYAVLQAFDYARRAGDEDLVRAIFPFLEWCFDAQASWLSNGMLPFNGDETYVAGGVLARSHLNDGSAEATMLFIESGELLLDFAARHGLWDARRRDSAAAHLGDARSRYAANFLHGGRVAANNPDWRPVDDWPLFRHGVCEGSGRICWTARNAAGRYLAVEEEPGSIGPVERPRRFLRSVSLTPLFLGSSLVPREVSQREARAAADEFVRTGFLPSVEGTTRTVGYDFGLLLNALAHLDDPAGAEVARLVLAHRDASGAWVEYYDAGAPAGCRCRPWESGVNIAGLLAWARRRRPA